MDLYLLAVARYDPEPAADAVLQGDDQLGVLGWRQRSGQSFGLAVFLFQATAGFEDDLLNEGLQTAATGEGRELPRLVDEGPQKVVRGEIGEGFGFWHKPKGYVLSIYKNSRFSRK